MEGLSPPAADFRALVSQPLLLQAPLQGVLELLFNTLQAQGAAIAELQGQASERTRREAALLDGLAVAQEAAAREHRDTGERLRKLELCLQGASNLAGRHAALDDIAFMLGVTVPDAEPEGAKASAEPPREDSSLAAAAQEAQAAADAAAVQHMARLEATEAALVPQGGNSVAGAAASAPVSPAADASAIDSPAVAVQAPAAASSSPGLVDPLLPENSLHRPTICQQQAPEPTTEKDASTAADTRISASSGSNGGRERTSDSNTSAGLPAAITEGLLDTFPEQQTSPSSRPSDGSSCLPADSSVQQGAQPASACALLLSQRGSGSGSRRPTSAGSETRAVTAEKSYPTDAVALPQLRTHASALVSPLSSQGPAIQAPALNYGIILAGQDSKSSTAHLEHNSPPDSPLAAPHLPPAQQAAMPAVPAASSLPADTLTEQALPAAAREAAVPASQGTVEAAKSPLARSPLSRSPLARSPPTVAAEHLSGGESVPVSARRGTEASLKLLEVANLLRKRPSIVQGNGLLWRLQASLEEAVAEQEQLKWEVVALQERLQAQQAATDAGLSQCSLRIDAVEAAVPSGTAGRPGGTTRFGTTWKDGGSVGGEDELLEGQGRADAAEAEAMKSARRLEVVELEVQEAAHRLTRLEAAQEAGAAALKLARGSSDGGGLAALQGHLLAQQQKLQAHMEGLAAGIQQAIPGQVHDAVMGAVGEVGKRLSDRLATKQELQTLSYKVTGKATREEVERLHRAHRAVAAALPSVEPGAGPAAGTKFKCISCDSLLQPFVFAAAPGALAQSTDTAELRYLQLPAASPQRNPQQTWSAAAVPVGRSPYSRPGSASPSHLVGGNSSSSGSGSGCYAAPAAQAIQPPLSSRPSTGASRFGASSNGGGWTQRQRRTTGTSSIDGAAGAASTGTGEAQGSGPRRDSLGRPADHLLHLQQQGRPQTAAPLRQHSSSSDGSGSPSPSAVNGGARCSLQPGQQQQDELGAGLAFYTTIREEPAGSTAAGISDGTRSSPRLGQHTTHHTTYRPQSASSKSATLPALVQPSGHTQVARPATAAAAPGSAEGRRLLADRESLRRTAASKRRTTGLPVGLS
ncbi:hypothetical protein D9Q98_004850 [Chlorella vulgaris]|uniref:Uncharacterized protein n=1 Tax=Chlorella vulgaris TaxID=3077 RepID=A0A9D4TNE7_CHLVU|nr:hypothetical protein D9Q98_004850 [Chlorella vulgaris]